MADATLASANVVISSPAQQFTRTGQFQALFYGKIYIGQIDKDPVDPKNQIDVFVEQEDGSLFKVPQPLRTNAAGFPVYNGKIVKFVTTAGHSMALYDARDVLQNYYNNVLKYDPDQFSGSVAGPDGLKVIGRCESVAQLRTIVGIKDQWISLESYNVGTHIGGGFFINKLKFPLFIFFPADFIKLTGVMNKFVGRNRGIQGGDFGGGLRIIFGIDVFGASATLEVFCGICRSCLRGVGFSWRVGVGGRS